MRTKHRRFRMVGWRVWESKTIKELTEIRYICMSFFDRISTMAWNVWRIYRQHVCKCILADLKCPHPVQMPIDTIRSRVSTRSGLSASSLSATNTPLKYSVRNVSASNPSVKCSLRDLSPTNTPVRCSISSLSATNSPVKHSVSSSLATNNPVKYFVRKVWVTNGPVRCSISNLSAINMQYSY